uniref:Surfeit 6 n=1 Tax=Macaca fascicularis TaxID=9541 RepID=A0A7N9CU66_MACFA
EGVSCELLGSPPWPLYLPRTPTCRAWPRRSAPIRARSSRRARGLAKLEAQKLQGPQKRKGRKHKRNSGSGKRRLLSTRPSPWERSLQQPLGPGGLRQPKRKQLGLLVQQGTLQGSAKELSPAALEKKRRRKQERDRKKRKRKELRAKEKARKAEEAAEAQEAVEPAPEGACTEPREPPGLIFNKVEVSEDEPASKAQRRKEKRQRVKGNLTPLTGRNYRQLLERLQARQSRLDELRDRDEGKAQELEAKMKWTNLLYKAEGVKIRDDERLLQEALRRKEKRRAQRQRRWEKRTAGVVEKMQQRQDRRRQNPRGRRRPASRLLRARKKGRILPQDLERAGLV